MKHVLTVKKENKGKKDEAFVVRNENDRFQASFAYLVDAELFATMMGCNACEQAVRDHVRLKFESDEVTKEIQERMNQTGHA